MRVFLAILWKDLVTEWRQRDRVVSMLVFSILMVVVFYFALPASTPERAQELLPGLLWVAYVFAALLGLNRAFTLELENDALSGLALAPADRGWVFLGKATANLILIGVVQAVTAAIFGIFFDVNLVGVALPLAGLVLLGSIGLCAAGTLFSAMAVRTRFSELLLPILLLPALFPILAGAVSGTTAILAGEGFPVDAARLLGVVDIIYLIVSFLGFDYILDE